MATRKTAQEAKTKLEALAQKHDDLKKLEKMLSPETREFLEKVVTNEVMWGLVVVRITEIMADYFGIDPNNLHLLKK